MSTLMLTGFPGFLGRELLPRLLRRDTDRDAVCLVQPRFRDLAAQRVAELVAAEPAVTGRIELVEGDLTDQDLGLRGRWSELTERVTEVHHLAAVYDLEVPAALARRVNVEGTRHVVAFCRAARDLHRLHHVSTCYVSGRWPGIFREGDLVRGQRFHNAYERSKYLAEVIVADARDAGLPVTVYRPSVVGGDAATGATQKYDGPYYVIRWVLKQPKFAVVPLVGDGRDHRFNAVPRDFVLDAIDALAARRDTVGGTYALADPEPATVRSLVELIADAADRRLVTVPLTRAMARGALRGVPGLRALMELPPAAVDYFSHPAHYTTDEADRLLAQERIRRPPRDDWFRAMVGFVREHPRVASTAMT